MIRKLTNAEINIDGKTYRGDISEYSVSSDGLNECGYICTIELTTPMEPFEGSREASFLCQTMNVYYGDFSKLIEYGIHEKSIFE